MANYENKYQINFSNIDGDDFVVYVLQKEYTGAVYILPAAASPFVLNYRDNNESVYAPIKASEATIRIVSTNGFDIRTLVSDDDTEFKVELYSIKESYTKLLWSGFIDSYSCTEELLDDPRIISLKAVDGIGLLKKQEFLDESGNTIYDKKTLVEIIYYCIYKTGIHNLRLNIEVNVYEENMDDRTLDPDYDSVFQTSVHTRSFIEKLDKFKDCYTILESIMRAFNATFFQADGAWYMVRFPDRWNSSLIYQSRYVWPYSIPADHTQLQFRHNVNLVDVVPITSDHQRGFIPPAKCGIITYNYDISPEIPRNSSFRQGSFDSTYSDDNTRIYSVLHWTYESGTVTTPVPITLVAPYRQEDYDVDVTFRKRLTDEYIVLPSNAGGDDTFKRLRCNQTIDVNKNDALSFSVDTRAHVNYTGPASSNAVYIILYGKSGQKYTLQDDATWTATANSASGSALTISISTELPAGEWRTINVQADDFPEDGALAVWLMEWTFPKPNETNFKNLSLSFRLNANVVGEEAKVCQLTDKKENEDRTITIGNAPGNLINGSMLRSSDPTVLCTWWYQYGSSEQKKLSEILARDVFRARKRLKTKIDGTIKGVVMEMPGDTDYNTIISPITHIEYGPISGYVYIPSSLEINIEANTARVYLWEFYNSLYDNEFEEGDTQSFKYLF